MKTVDQFSSSLKWLLALGIFLLLTGCNAREGSVLVDVGEASLATAYRVDLYAREPGLDLVKGKYAQVGLPVTLAHVREGKWALLIQALDGEQTTIAYYQAHIEVVADETTEVTASVYKPGTPADLDSQSDSSLASFGPAGEALLSATYGPVQYGLPEANVSVQLVNGEGQATVADPEATPTVPLSRALGSSIQCGTGFISTADVEEADFRMRDQRFRTRSGEVNPGETKEFFVITTFSNVVCQRLLTDAQTAHCLIFAEIVDGSPVISKETALAVAQGFDRENPFQLGGSGIYTDTRSRLGSEWLTGGGRDGDERVVFVFLSSNSIGGEGLFGFFNPADERSKEDNPSSNAGEILFLNGERAEADLYDALGTIAHEFSHLIMFNQKVAQEGAFPAGAQPENAVLDEGLAVLNEELSGFGYTGERGGNFFLLSAVSNLLEDGLNRSYFQFGGKLSDYGAGYLLWRYIHDQLGPEAILTLSTSTQIGRENIQTLLDEPFVMFFQRFAQAVALNGKEDLPANLRFTSLDLQATYPSREGTTFTLAGLQKVIDVTLPGTLQETTAVQSWGTLLYRATGGDGSELSWSATGADSLATSIVSLDAPLEPDPIADPALQRIHSRGWATRSE